MGPTRNNSGPYTYLGIRGVFYLVRQPKTVLATVLSRTAVAATTAITAKITENSNNDNNKTESSSNDADDNRNNKQPRQLQWHRQENFRNKILTCFIRRHGHESQPSKRIMQLITSSLSLSNKSDKMHPFVIALVLLLLSTYSSTVPNTPIRQSFINTLTVSKVAVQMSCSRRMLHQVIFQVSYTCRLDQYFFVLLLFLKFLACLPRQ